MNESPEELEARIAAYLDGELSPAEAARLEVFLANTDQELARHVLGMTSDKHLIRTLPRVVAPNDLSARVMEQIERSTLLHDTEHWTGARRHWWHRGGGWAAAAAVIIIAGGVSYMVVQSLVQPRTPWQQAIVTPSEGRKADLSATGEGDDLGEHAKINGIPAPARVAALPPRALDVKSMASATQPGGMAFFGSARRSAALAPAAPARTVSLALSIAPRDAAESQRLLDQLAAWSSENDPTAAAAEKAALPGNALNNLDKNALTSADNGGQATQNSPAPQNGQAENFQQQAQQFPQVAAADARQEQAPSGPSAAREQKQLTAANVEATDQSMAGKSPEVLHVRLRREQLAALELQYRVTIGAWPPVPLTSANIEPDASIPAVVPSANSFQMNGGAGTQPMVTPMMMPPATDGTTTAAGEMGSHVGGIVMRDDGRPNGIGFGSAASPAVGRAPTSQPSAPAWIDCAISILPPPADAP